MSTLLNWRVLGMALLLEAIVIAVLLMPVATGTAEARNLHRTLLVSGK